MLRSFFLVFLLLCTCRNVSAQCSVVVASNNGYSVNIRVQPVMVVPSTYNCQWGYNYNIVLNYTVTFTGSNAPSSLHTLQGNVICNTSQSLFFDLPNGGGTGSYTTSSNPYIGSDGSYLYTTHPSCNTANVNNLNCGGITIDINGPGLSNRTVNCASAGPLPIELAYFNGTSTAEGNFLEWRTETEVNNAYFQVEKSTNGFDWSELVTIAGAGTTRVAQQYSYTDISLESGVNYYRLKQVDFDNSVSYSPIIAVHNSVHDLQCSAIWPNPTHASAKFLLDAPSKGNAGFRILNEVGAPVKEGGFVFFTGKNEIEIPVSELPQGFYVVELMFGNQQILYRKMVRR